MNDKEGKFVKDMIRRQKVRTKYLSRGFAFILLALAFATSMVFVATPASAKAFIGTNYSGQIIQVAQGGTFVLRTTIRWDEVANGYYGVTIYWEDNNHAYDNFTVLYTRAFFDNDNDNQPDAGVEMIENTTTVTIGAGVNGTGYTFSVGNMTGNENNGYVDIEIYMLAASRGVVHRPWDNHTINDYGYGAIDYAEGTTASVTPDVTTIKVLAGGVRVLISPPYQSGLPGTLLSYTVTVLNTGEYDDNYSLTASDNVGWGPNISPNSLAIPKGENRTASLSVTVPINATGCTQDNITVMAVGAAVENSASCIAHASIVRGIQVVIEPPSQENENGGTLAYTVTVKNVGNVQENFQLTRGDNTGWTLALDNTWLLVPKGENRTTRLTVNIPSNARGCTWDNIWVKATSKDNLAAFDNKSCLAHVTIVRGVQVSISPPYKSAQPESTITYTLTVMNTGNAIDTYDLTVSDNSSWSPIVSPSSLQVPPSENRTAEIRVTVPSGTPYCTENDIIATATSRSDNTVKDNDSCIAHAAALRRVMVVITPAKNSALSGATLSYTVTITNTGNISDNYTLTDNDNMGWGPTVSPSMMELAMNQSDNATLSVTIPENTAPCTQDNVIVTAASQGDPSVSGSASCIAHRVKPQFSLATLYKVAVGLDFYLHTGSKLVVKFFTYGGDYQGENVFWSGIIPTQISENENVPHPLGNPVENIVLVLTGDNTENVISIVGSFIVRKDDLWNRLIEIRRIWPYATPSERDALWAELINIRRQWPYAPS